TNGNTVIVAGKNLAAGFTDGALHEGARDGVGTVKNEDREISLGGSFEEIAQGGFVRVKTDTRILNVDDHSIERFEDFRRRAPLGIGAAVDAVDGHAGGRIFGIADGGGVEFSGDAVLRTENHCEGNSRGVRQNVDGAVALSVNAGLVGQQADLGAALLQLQR